MKIAALLSRYFFSVSRVHVCVCVCVFVCESYTIRKGSKHCNTFVAAFV